MALKKPLVLTGGGIEQLQAGDTLDAAIAAVDESVLTNGGAGSATIGQAVYISAANTFQLARANASGTARAVGLVKAASIAAAATGTVQKSGTLAATTGQWDTVTGQTGGLTAGSVYYLSEATSGQLTTTPPTTGFVTRVGLAQSTTEMIINFEVPIRL